MSLHEFLEKILSHEQGARPCRVGTRIKGSDITAGIQEVRCLSAPTQRSQLHDPLNRKLQARVRRRQIVGATRA